MEEWYCAPFHFFSQSFPLMWYAIKPQPPFGLSSPPSYAEVNMTLVPAHTHLSPSPPPHHAGRKRSWGQSPPLSVRRLSPRLPPAAVCWPAGSAARGAFAAASTAASCREEDRPSSFPVQVCRSA